MSNRRHCADHTDVAFNLFIRECADEHTEAEKRSAWWEGQKRQLALCAPVLGFILAGYLWCFGDFLGYW